METVLKNPVQETLDNLDETLIRLKNEHVLPGLAVGVVQDGKLVFAKGYGLANIEKEHPATPDTIFRIGSISKTFTAVGIMQLWEQGKFQLDDPVNDYLKAYKLIPPDPAATAITFRHLLTHTSGIGEVRSLTDVFLPTVGLSAKADQPRVPLSQYYQDGLRAEVSPGTKWAYANHAFATLGQLIEDISGQPFPEYMIEHVFTPLGMYRSDYLFSERVASGLAQGYAFKGGRFVSVEYTRIVVEGAGSIFSNVTEMSRYASALMGGGKNEFGAVLKPETLALMMEPQVGTDPRVFGMGLAFILDRYGSHRIAWHNGGWTGFVSAMYVAPDDRLAVIVFTNSSSPAPDAIAVEVMHNLLGIPQPGEQAQVPGLLEAPHQWPEMVGFYGPRKGFLTNLRIWMGMGGEVEIFVQKNHLALRALSAGPMLRGLPLHRADAGNPLLYHAVQEGRVIPVLFKRGPAGSIDKVQVGPNVFEKRPFVESLRFKLLAACAALLGGVGYLAAKRISKQKD